MFLNTNSQKLLRTLICRIKSNAENTTSKVVLARNSNLLQSFYSRFSIFETKNPVVESCKKRFKISLTKYLSSAPSQTCWSCNKVNSDTDAIFCVHCNTIQKPNKDDTYFNVIGIHEGFDVDELSLSKKYKNLQKLLHPDKFSIRDEKEQQISAEYSSLVNKAYSTLSQPLSRGLYLLSLKGLQISEETQVESEFLHQIMERNEAVEEAETVEEILKINTENKQIISELIAKLSAAFKADDLNSAIKVLIRMKYFVSIENQIKDITRRMEVIE